MPGYVYCLTNPSIPGLVKIGSTSHDPKVRANQLSAASGVPNRFEIAWSIPVAEPAQAELQLHEALEACRVNNRREFFRCTPAEAKACAGRIRSFRAALRHAAGSDDGRLGFAMTAVLGIAFGISTMMHLDLATTMKLVAGGGLLTMGVFSLSGVRRLGGGAPA